jgi:ABC-type nitrate/sulfonate/bicarbonate transport system permease component
MDKTGIGGLIRNGLLATLSIALIFVAWKAYVVITGYPPYIVASPETAIAHLWNNWGEMLPLLNTTLYETAIGYVLGAAVGFLIAVLTAQSQFTQRLSIPASSYPSRFPSWRSPRRWHCCSVSA